MKKIRLDIHDLLILVGGVLAAYGLWQIYHPLAYIVVGGVIGWLGIKGSQETK